MFWRAPAFPVTPGQPAKAWRSVPQISSSLLKAEGFLFAQALLKGFTLRSNVAPSYAPQSPAPTPQPQALFPAVLPSRVAGGERSPWDGDFKCCVLQNQLLCWEWMGEGHLAGTLAGV